MGTKGSKPLSSLVKRQEKAAKREEKKARKEVAPQVAERKALSDVTEDLIKRVSSELPTLGIVTPLLLAQRYGLKISTARRLAKALVERNLAEIKFRNRRVIIVTPKST